MRGGIGITTGTVASEPEGDCVEVPLFPGVPHWVVTLIRKAGFSLLKEAVKPAWAEGRTPLLAAQPVS